jgi:hypothetical protein
MVAALYQTSLFLAWRRGRDGCVDGAQKKQHQANFVAAQQKHGDETKSDQQKRDNAAKRDPCFLLNKSVTTRC